MFVRTGAPTKEAPQASGVLESRATFSGLPAFLGHDKNYKTVHSCNA